MHKSDQTYTNQLLNSSSMSDVLEAARTASRWESGVPNVRGAARSDLGGEGPRPSCTLAPRDVIGPAAEADLSSQRGAAEHGDATQTRNARLVARPARARPPLPPPHTDPPPPPR